MELVTEIQVTKVTVRIIGTHPTTDTIKRSTKPLAKSRQSGVLKGARVRLGLLGMLAYLGVTLPTTVSANLVYQQGLSSLTPF
jgi:hypothetical protein